MEGMTMREICGYDNTYEIICGDKNCDICYDRKWLKKLLNVKTLTVKNMGGKPDKPHKDLVKKTREIEEKQRLLLEETKSTYDKIINDVKIGLNKMIDLNNKSEKLNEEFRKMEYQYPICNRVWGIGDDPTLKLKDYDFQIEEFPRGLSDELTKMIKREDSVW